MEKENVTSLSSALQEVQRQFEQRRERRKGREPIPDRLWQAAIGLCKRHSITEVARVLRLNRADLKKKAEISTQESAGFLEFQFPLPLSCVQWTVEMEKASGSKFRLSCQGGSIDAIVEIGKTFWSHG